MGVLARPRRRGTLQHGLARRSPTGKAWPIGRPPHDFFAAVLAGGGKRRLLARLGLEAEDPLDEFISLTLAYERTHPPSLQGFLHWLEQGDVEIKRDLDQAGNDAVRIMTVHGAKGLQAPIVFLPDTLQVPTRLPRLLWLEQDGPEDLLLWPPRAERPG